MSGYIISASDALDNWRDGQKQVEKERAFNPKWGEAYDHALAIALPQLDTCLTMDDLRATYDAGDISLCPALESAEEMYDLYLSLTVLEDLVFFKRGQQLIQAAAEQGASGA